ncbi:MAG: GHKL domain-containing protein [Oscillospiraceae bacterium]|nr:GHKL domain-containing protein [Oscillospiraceae bacterium]
MFNFDDLRSDLEKNNRRCAILNQDYKIVWDKDGFFGSWTNIEYPEKEAFFNKKEIIISVGPKKSQLPVAVCKKVTDDDEVFYTCRVIEHDTVADIIAHSPYADIYQNFFADVNDTAHAVQFLTEQSAKSPLVQSDDDLRSCHKNLMKHTNDLLAYATNCNYYLNASLFLDSDSKIDIFKKVDGLIKKCNELLKRNIIIFNSKESDKTNRIVKIPERIFVVVFLNLIQNALLYSKDESKIEVKVFFENNFVTLSVTNEIESNQMPEKFSERIKLGIGIPLVTRVVTHIGGKVSNEQEGSTYKSHITLPLYNRNNEEAFFKRNEAEFITQNSSYIKRYLHRFME